MRKKRFLYLIFTLILCFLPACRDAADEVSNVGSVPNEEKSDTDLYGYDSPVTIKVGLGYASDFQWCEGESPEENSWMDLYKEHNINPKIMYVVDATQSESRLEMGILSGDYPDIITISPSEYQDYIERGVIADITDAYEKYASDELKAYLQMDDGQALETMTMDGHLYGIPRIINPYEEVPMMFIRKDWLAHLGLEVPDTMDEMKQVAHAFTYDDPDGNGVDDTYGLALDGQSLLSNTIGDASAIFAAYGAHLGSDGLTMVEGEDGTITWGGANSEGMKAALTLLQELYQDGSLSKDFIIKNSNDIFDDAGNGTCGIWFGPNWAGMVPASRAAQQDIGAHIIAAPVPSGIEGEKTKLCLPNSARSVFCVSSKCDNPEVLIKMLNLSVQKLCYPETEEEYYKYQGDGKNYTGWKASLTAFQPVTDGYENWIIYQNVIKTEDTTGLSWAQKQDAAKLKAYYDAVEEQRFDPQDDMQSLGIAMETVFGKKECAWEVISQMKQEHLFVKQAVNILESDHVTDNTMLKQLTVETLIKIITGKEVDTYDSFLEIWYQAGAAN